MKNDPKKILVAIAWPYVNGELHIGHLAGYLLPADVFARFHRLKGNDVLMVSGSDCHGTPITVEADKLKLTPQEVVDKYHPRDLDLLEQYDLSYNLYTKTTTENHKKVAQGIFLDLLTNDFIVKDTMQQYYSPKDDKFLPDRYVEGTCPHCKATEQRSDQCENCGRWLKDGELIDPVSKLTGEKVELKDTEHYFLDFPKLQDDLKVYLGEGKSELWRNWVYKEANGWLEEGLQKRAITRDLDWSIELPIDEIPEDKRIEGIEDKRIYVWFEAVIGYLSAPQEWSPLVQDKEDKYIHERTDDYILRFYKGQDKDWTKWWYASESEHYYFMGQDNLVFHTLMWPGQLIGANKNRKKDERYTLPKNVVVNKFLNFNESKFSKSRNNVVDSKEIAEEFGTDAVRYFILANLPENKESNFTWERFVDAVNNELVANLGNFVNRTLVFYSKYLEGQVEGDLEDKVEAEIQDTFQKVGQSLESCELVDALDKIMKLTSFGNKYFNDAKIWEIVKEDEKRSKTVMLNLLNIVEALRILINPFLPEAHKRLSEMLGLDVVEPEVGQNLWKFEPISGYENLGKVEPLFKKLDKERVLASKIEIKKEKIDTEELLKPIKIVQIKAIEKHPNADSLFIVTVYDGQKETKIVTAATNIKEDDLVPYLGSGEILPGPYIKEGKEFRLQKKNLRGIESEGMILAEDEIGIGDDHDGIVVLDCGKDLIGKSILEVYSEKDIKDV